ncbi:MAG: hypothetical protein ACFE0I_17805 [Elainellaceae cyanobacterium]
MMRPQRFDFSNANILLRSFTVNDDLAYQQLMTDFVNVVTESIDKSLLSAHA